MNKIEQIEQAIELVNHLECTEKAWRIIDACNEQKVSCYELINQALQTQLAIEQGDIDVGQWKHIDELNESGLENFIIADFNNIPAFISFGWKPFNFNGKWVKYTGGDLVGIHNLTHFMAIPQPPKEK